MTAENRSVTAGKLGEAGSETGLVHDRANKADKENVRLEIFSHKTFQLLPTLLLTISVYKCLLL